MSRRFYNLPPLTTLAAFEAAARHLSFKSAAVELAVTPGAVSHQIRALEGELNTQLFLRQHRGVELTQGGEQLYESLAGSFAKISQSLARIREDGTQAGVTIGASTAVASLWMGPMVSRFWRAHGDINVTQITGDWGFEGRSEIDLYIRYGRPPAGPLDVHALWSDVLVPVAAPAVAEALSGASLADLAAGRLIHHDSANRNWTSWEDWFSELGHDGPLARGMRVNNYTIALQAAGDGAGVVLGWKQLIAPLIAAGTLAPVQGFSLPAPHRFHLVTRRDGDLSPAARDLRDFIMEDGNDAL